MMVSAAYLIALDIGIKVSLVDCFIIVPSVMLVATIPISIGGWGVREVLWLLHLDYWVLPLPRSLHFLWPLDSV